MCFFLFMVFMRGKLCKYTIPMDFPMGKNPESRNGSEEILFGEAKKPSKPHRSMRRSSIHGIGENGLQMIHSLQNVCH